MQNGVRHWRTTATDGTSVELICFDFAQNPALKFELYDQDEDDAKPLDNVVDYSPLGAGGATRKLNARFAAQKKGRVVALWNGLFFGYYNKTRPKNRESISERAGHHVAPVVINGKAHYGPKNHRWSFGVKYANNRPVFKAAHLPTRQWLERELDFGGGSAQCLVLNGKPLNVQPAPPVGKRPLKGPVPSTPRDAGHIPTFDHMRTSRMSMAWTRDNSKLFLLAVKEPDNESASAVAFLREMPPNAPEHRGGWTVRDVQRFWLSAMPGEKIWTAINSDGGNAAQMTLLRPDKKYDLLPPREVSSAMRLTYTAQFQDAPKGGALMYFYVRDESAK